MRKRLCCGRCGVWTPTYLTDLSDAALVPLFAPISALLPFLFYRHSKSFWMSIDFLIHPVALR